jgi:hypothetical protein
VNHADYTANNSGLLLALTVIPVVLLPLLLWAARSKGQGCSKAQWRGSSSDINRPARLPAPAMRTTVP